MLIRTKLLPKDVLAMAIWPFILINSNFYKGKKISKNIITHEKIHLRQQVETLFIFFYLWYGVEYLVRLWQYKDTYKAYKNISFEREAYANEKDDYFLQYREPLNFINYLY